LCFVANSASAHLLFYKFWQHYINEYAEKHVPDVATLSEQEKQIYFKEDVKKTVAILLYEFSIIEQKYVQHRYFDTSHALAKNLMQSSGFKFVIKQYQNNKIYLNTTTNKRSMDSFRYTMTPRCKNDIKSFPKQSFTAFKEHVRWLFNPKLSQIFLGSYAVWIAPGEQNWVNVTIENKTSRNSLFMHIPPSVEKPSPFGTIKQTFNLSINLNNY